MRRGVGTLDVFTFKAGVLAVAAHDLHLRLEEFSVELEGESVRAEFPLERLRLLGPVENGVTQAGRYRPDQVAAVESATHEEILRVGEHPTARFIGRATTGDGGWDVEGQLELGGTHAPIRLHLARDGDHYRGRIVLHPSRWGIPEYRAMLGAIRLQDRVRVDVTVREA
jgi:hypothetical protein